MHIVETIDFLIILLSRSKRREFSTQGILVKKKKLHKYATSFFRLKRR